MFLYQQSLSWMAHWKMQSHLQLDRGLLYFLQDLALPNERWAPQNNRSSGFFWIWRKALKSDDMQMPWEYWSLSSSLAWPCPPFPLVYKIIFFPNLRLWYHNVKQLSYLVDTFFLLLLFFKDLPGICCLGSTWVFRGICFHYWVSPYSRRTTTWVTFLNTHTPSFPYCISLPPIENWPRL